MKNYRPVLTRYAPGLLLSMVLSGIAGNRSAAQTTAAPDKNNRDATLSGRIEDGSSGEQLIGVTVTAPYHKKGTLTNNFGYYSLTLPADTATISISYLGYATLDTLIHMSGQPVINFRLKPHSGKELETVTINSNKDQEIQNTSQMGKITIPIAQIQSLPKFFGEADVMKALQTLPGVQQGSEGTSALLVRGGTADQNLILLDGAPLYNPSHLLGVFSAFNTNAIKNVELYKGAFPARFGGRLSSVIDLAMKDGNMHQVHGNFSLGLLASQLTVEGPIKKGKTSFIVSGRRTYHDLYAAPVIKNVDKTVKRFALYFYDLNAKIHHRFSDQDHLYLSGYMGGDKLRLKTLEEGGNSTSASDNTIQWGNMSGTLRWNHIFSSKLFLNTTLVASRYKFSTKIGSEDVFDGKTSRYDLDISSGIVDYTGKADINYQPSAAHSIRVGASYTYHTFNPGSNFYQETFNSVPVSGMDINNRINSTELDVYAEDDWELTDKLKANIGLHGSAFRVEDTWYTSLQPRLSARYLLPGDWALKAAYARMTQYMHLLASNSISLPTDLWVPATKNIRPQQADQVSLGVARNILNNTLEFSIEGYYKKMDHIIEYKEGSSYLLVGGDDGWEDKVTSGKGESYGAELFVQKKTGKLTGWVGYTLAWANRTLPDINFGKTFPYKYDRRHTLNMVAVYKWKPGIELSGAFIYQSAAPFTLPTMQFEGATGSGMQNGYGSLEYIPARNNIRIQNTHRLDVGISFIKEKKNGRIRTWNISVYNVYNRKNLFFYEVDGYNNNKVDISGYSLLPIMPSVSYSLKF